MNGPRPLAALLIAVSLWVGTVPRARSDVADADDPFARVVRGDAAGVVASLSDGYRNGALDLRVARLYQDLRVEAGQGGALQDESKAFRDPATPVARHLLARIGPRKECDAALARLLPLAAPTDLGYVLLDQVWAALRNDDLPRATGALARAKRLVGDAEETILAEASLLEANGDRPLAEKLLAGWCASHPDAVDARAAWVDALLALRRRGDAASVAEQGLTRVRAPALLAARAAVAVEVLDHDVAKKALDEAKVAGRPAVRARVLALRAGLLLAAKDLDGAESTARAAAEASPTSVDALRVWARALEAKGKAGDALTRLAEALDARPWSAPVLVDRAAVLHGVGKDKEAKKALADARKRDPGCLEAVHWQGVVAESESDWAAAEKAYRAVLKLDPDRLETRRMLAGILFSTSRLDAAATEAAWIRERQPKDPHAWFLTGRIELKNDKTDEAMLAFDKAVEADKTYALGHVGRGWVFEERQQPEEAKKAYEAAISADPAFALPHRYLGELLEEKGDAPDAARHYKAYLELGGADPDDDVRHAVERLSK